MENNTIWNYQIEETDEGVYRVTESDYPGAKGCGEYATLDAAQAAVPSPTGYVWEDSQTDDGRYVGTMSFPLLSRV